MTTAQETESAGLTEVELLEAAFNEELRCESLHQSGEPADFCSVDVTYKYSACIDHGRWRFVCQSHADRVFRWKSVSSYCRDCLELVADCWKIIPI